MRLAIVLFACGAALLFAGDPWKDKKPAEWTGNDYAKVLTSSPWAKTVTAQVSGSMVGRRGGGAAVGVDGGGGGRRGAGGGGMSGAPGSGGLIGNGDSGASGGGGDGPSISPSGPKVAVRWETSEPLLQAFDKAAYSLLPNLREWSKDFYVITAAGMPVRLNAPPARREGSGDAKSEPPAQVDPKELMERFIHATALKRKGKDPIAPARIEMLRIGGALVPMFFFPRTDAISAADKEVVFESAFGGASVKAKFDVKDMLYDGKLSL